jgi:predicted dehydrogenase
MKKNLKAAVIGCGRIGAEFDNDPKRTYISTHAGAYKAVKKVDLVAVCDIDRSKALKCAKKLEVPSVYTSVKDMMVKETIDILSICTPPDSHYSILKEVSRYPIKAVFCEKPLAGSLKKAEAMVNLCYKKNIILQVGHQRRFDMLHQQLRQFIIGKEMGKVLQANFYYTAGVKNTGSHMLDLMRFFFGDTDWVEAFYSKNKSDNIKDPNLDGLLKFKSGLLATFQACDVRKYLIFELNILFEKGRIILKNSGFDIECYNVKPSNLFSGYYELSNSGKCFKTYYKRNFMVSAVNHLIMCVNEKKPSISSGTDGFKAMDIIEKSLFSAKNSGMRLQLIR